MFTCIGHANFPGTGSGQTSLGTPGIAAALPSDVQPAAVPSEVAAAGGGARGCRAKRANEGSRKHRLTNTPPQKRTENTKIGEKPENHSPPSAEKQQHSQARAWEAKRDPGACRGAAGLEIVNGPTTTQEEEPCAGPYTCGRVRQRLLETCAYVCSMSILHVGAVMPYFDSCRKVSPQKFGQRDHREVRLRMGRLLWWVGLLWMEGCCPKYPPPRSRRPGLPGAPPRPCCWHFPVPEAPDPQTRVVSIALLWVRGCTISCGWPGEWGVTGQGCSRNWAEGGGGLTPFSPSDGHRRCRGQPQYAGERRVWRGVQVT